MAGLTAAWCLDRQGWEVLVVERMPGPRGAGYMIDFQGPGYEVAERMGLLPALRRVHRPIPGINYVDGDGRAVARLDYALFDRLQRGRLISLMRGDLERVLLDALPGRVEIRYGRSIDAVEPAATHVDVVLTDGADERADLLIGADGIHSRVRELVFGAEHRFLRPLGLHTAAYVMSDARLAAALCGSFSLMSVPDRLAGLYPVDGSTLAAFLAHRTTDQTLPPSPCAELRRVYGDLGWLVPEALSHCDDAAVYYDHVAQVAMPRWTRGRVVLVGDACQAVSLLAGQGASLAMAGSYALAAELDRGPIDPALARYHARMKPMVERRQAAGRRLAGWVVPPNRRRIAARNIALRTAAHPGFSRLLRPLLADNR